MKLPLLAVCFPASVMYACGAGTFGAKQSVDKQVPGSADERHAGHSVTCRWVFKATRAPLGRAFGRSVVVVGDLTGDGTPEIAVSDPDDESVILVDGADGVMRVRLQPPGSLANPISFGILLAEYRDVTAQSRLIVGVPQTAPLDGPEEMTYLEYSLPGGILVASNQWPGRGCGARLLVLRNERSGQSAIVRSIDFEVPNRIELRWLGDHHGEIRKAICNESSSWCQYGALIQKVWDIDDDSIEDIALADNVSSRSKAVVLISGGAGAELSRLHVATPAPSQRIWCIEPVRVRQIGGVPTTSLAVSVLDSQLRAGGAPGTVNLWSLADMKCRELSPAGREKSQFWGASLCNVGDLDGRGADDLAVMSAWPEELGRAAYIVIVSGEDGAELSRIVDGRAGPRFGASMCLLSRESGIGTDLLVSDPTGLLFCFALK